MASIAQDLYINSLDDGELTRRRDKLALVRGPNTTASGTPPAC
jgi:hypothetical protein